MAGGPTGKGCPALSRIGTPDQLYSVDVLRRLILDDDRVMEVHVFELGPGTEAEER